MIEWSDWGFEIMNSKEHEAMSLGEEAEKGEVKQKQLSYDEDSIQTLEWYEHIRHRPGMYIGKLGDGSQPDDGIYVLLKEVFDNSLDEHMMGHGNRIEVTLDGELGVVTVRDYGRGIPLGSVVDVASKMNTGAKYETGVFSKSVGLNGVGIKAVNALSSSYELQSFRDGESAYAIFSGGVLQSFQELDSPGERNGTLTRFTPDASLFQGYAYRMETVRTLLRNYTFLNTGLTITLNDEIFQSKDGLLDLLTENMTKDPLYPPIHLKGRDIEVALTHTAGYGEDYYTFVNGQHTSQGGTHLAAFRESVARVFKDFYKKDLDPEDIRMSLIGALSLRVEEPVFESQTKTKLGSKEMGPNGPSVRQYIGDFLREELDNWLHRHADVAEVILQKIQDSERDRKSMAGIRKLAKERAKKAALNNPKLRDCRVHYNSNHDRAGETTIFITEGDSASGSITKSRDPNVQAVFSLRGKPKNTYGLSKRIVYENEEFNLLQAALNIEEGVENLRYNRVVIATDADVDGMHIRLLLVTFFLQFYPDVIRQGHLYIFQTPLFRVRNKKETHYCYSEAERDAAVEKLKGKPEITRFKGLGEISPDEFRGFLGESMRLDPVKLSKEDMVDEMLLFFMGNNTPVRQDFIIDNLRVEEDAYSEVDRT